MQSASSTQNQRLPHLRERGKGQGHGHQAEPAGRYPPSLEHLTTKLHWASIRRQKLQSYNNNNRRKQNIYFIIFNTWPGEKTRDTVATPASTPPPPTPASTPSPTPVPAKGCKACKGRGKKRQQLKRRLTHTRASP